MKMCRELLFFLRSAKLFQLGIGQLANFFQHIPLRKAVQGMHRDHDLLIVQYGFKQRIQDIGESGRKAPFGSTLHNPPRDVFARRILGRLDICIVDKVHFLRPILVNDRNFQSLEVDGHAFSQLIGAHA